MHYNAMRYNNDYQIHYCIFIIYDKLPDTLYMLMKSVAPWWWSGYVAETCRSCV